MNEWQQTLLADVLKIKHGFAFKGEFIEKDGPLRLVTPGNFIDAGGFRDRGASQKSYGGPVPDRFRLPPGALVVAMTEQAPGLLGSSGLVPDDGAQWLHNQRIGLVEHDDAIADRRFLYYLFNAAVVRRQINATATGTKVRHTAPGRIGDVSVRLPRPTMQRAISAALGAFDDLIAVNERRIELLDGLARSMYQEWFEACDYPRGDESSAVRSASDVFEIDPRPERGSVPSSRVTNGGPRGAWVPRPR